MIKYLLKKYWDPRNTWTNGLKVLRISNKYVRQKDKSRLYFKNVDKTRNCFIEETKQNDFASEKSNITRLQITLNTYLFYFLRLWLVSIFGFVSSVGIAIGLERFTNVLEICVISAGIRKHKLIIQSKRQKHGL